MIGKSFKNVLTKDINPNEFNVANKLVKLDANADIPAAQIGEGSISGDKLSAGAEAAHMYPKVVSDNLRHSHDAVVETTTGTYEKLKTFTFEKGIKGTLRIKFDSKKESGPGSVFGKIYKNREPIGTEREISNFGDYNPWTEDIDVGTLNPNDTIEIWGYEDDAEGKIRYFRIYYDNDTKPVTVEGVSNS